MKEDIKLEIRAETNKRNHIGRLFNTWLDETNEEQLDKLINILNSLLGNFPNNTADVISEHLENLQNEK